VLSPLPQDRFSADGMRRLALRARQDVDLQELLVARPELSPEAIDKLLPMVSEKILLKLHERGRDMGGAISPELLATVRERFADALRNRARRVATVNDYIESVRSGRLPLDAAADRLVEAERLLDFAVLVSAFAHMERMDVPTLAKQDELLPVLALLRSLDLAWTTVERFLIARRRKFRAATDPPADVRADYEANAVPLARRITRFLRVGSALPPSRTSTAR
jgi:hypothetical protein